ncbi:MAG TPA: CPBP family intramembrane glutamic endopeptidase [Chthoniobacterales bacterium]|nr:CPBP family intramembrane glutamic endopeptidase [Chthoniobacterales bacterium]
MKDAARLVAYFLGTTLFGALAAPLLFWAAQALAARGIFPALAQFDFESFFHRALLLGAIALLWPLLRWLGIKTRRDLTLEPNPRWLRDVGIGFVLSGLPVLICEIFLVNRGLYTMRSNASLLAVAAIIPASVVVPLIEEALFRGLFLGVLLRAFRPWTANVISAAIFSIVHFLKAPDETTTSVHWFSGFLSLAHSTDQFSHPLLVLGGFTTLFVIGVALAHSRIRTQSLWLPIGLHAGWVFGNEAFSKIARREVTALPWLGKSLLVGLVPLAVCLLSWVLLRLWLRYAEHRAA